MNKNILIILAGGFLIAILVAVLVQSTLSGSKKEEDVERIEILVAAKDLSVGREVRSGDLKWQKWPEDTMFAGAIMRDGPEQQPTEAVKGKLLRSLVEGQPVHMNVVVEEDKGDFLSANLQKGMRAVGVAVKSHVVGDRLFRPGDFVDIMVTYRVRVNTRQNPEAQALVNRYATETVIENVRILAIDTNDTKAVDEEDDGGKKKKKKSSKRAIVTVEVSPEAAERLVLADKMGDIGFALRSIGDNSGDPNSDNTTTDVGMSRVMTDLSAMSGYGRGGKGSSAVRVYNGAKMEEVKPRNVVEEKGSVEFAVEDNADFSEEEFGMQVLEALIDNIQ